MRNNIVTATFAEGCYSTTTDAIYQYDKGLILSIDGVELPETFETHFSNYSYGGTAIPMIGSNGTVNIPDEVNTLGATVYVWIVLHTGTDDTETVLHIEIPVNRKSDAVYVEPTPSEQSIIEQAIAVLNQAIETSAQSIVVAQAALEQAQAVLREISTMSFHIDENGCLILTQPEDEE